MFELPLALFDDRPETAIQAVIFKRKRITRGDFASGSTHMFSVTMTFDLQHHHNHILLQHSFLK
jgi:hypothetical protein